MTIREYHETIINLLSDNEEVIKVAKNELKKLDARVEKDAKAREEKLASEKPLFDSIIELLTTQPSATSYDIAMALDLKTTSGGVNYSKATALAKVLVEDGTLTAFDYKPPKGRSVKAYSLVKGD